MRDTHLPRVAVPTERNGSFFSFKFLGDLSGAAEAVTVPYFYFHITHGKARKKRAKYFKYDTPSHLFFPIPVSRTGRLADDTLLFCDAIASRFPDTPNVRHKLIATIDSAAIIGAARTCNSALRRLQLAALAHAPLAFVNSFNSKACAFDAEALLSYCVRASTSNIVSTRPDAAHNFLTCLRSSVTARLSLVNMR